MCGDNEVLLMNICPTLAIHLDGLYHIDLQFWILLYLTFFRNISLKYKIRGLFCFRDIMIEIYYNLLQVLFYVACFSFRQSILSCTKNSALCLYHQSYTPSLKLCTKSNRIPSGFKGPIMYSNRTKDYNAKLLSRK